MMIKFLVLGPIEICSDQRRVGLKGSLQRTVLVSLLASPGNFAPTDTLITEMWGETPPRRAENALQAHLSRLRRELDKLDAARKSPLLVTVPSGYQLMMGSDATDVMEFMRRVDQVISRETDMDPHDAAQELRSALSLWRGPAFGGTTGGPLCQALATRYEQSRATAIEQLFDLELQAGRHSEVIAELHEAASTDSLNEKMCAQLMFALYRTGRQADALATYRKMRARLDDELGLDPSPVLQNLEQAILTHDPALQAAPAPAYVAQPEPARHSGGAHELLYTPPTLRH